MNATNAKTAAALVEITGNTYPVKDALKAMGARWNADKKCWMISASKAQEAAALVGTARRTTVNSRPVHRPTFSRGFSGNNSGYWLCPGCGEDHKNSVSRCWECGMSRR